MAGVPGMTPEQRQALAEAEAGPGGYIEEVQRDNSGYADYVPHPGYRKNEVLGAIGDFAGAAGTQGSGKRRKLLAAGFANSLYGLDADGNLSFGETPGLFYDIKGLPALPGALGFLATKWMLKNVSGLPEEQAAERAQKMSDGSMPEFAMEAQAKSQAIKSRVHRDMDVGPAQGFIENAIEGIGPTALQIPMLGGAAGAAQQGMKAAANSAAKRVAKSIPEFLGPTIKPSVANYATGALGAGLFSKLLGDDEDEEPGVLLEGNQPGLWDVRPKYSDNRVGLSGNPEDLMAAYNVADKRRQLSEFDRMDYDTDLGQQGFRIPEYEDLALDPDKYADWATPQPGEERPVIRVAGHAKGGRIQDLLDSYMKQHGDGVYIGNNKKYREYVRQHLKTVPQEPEHLHILEEYAEAPWGWSPSEQHALKQIVNEHAVPLPPDLPLYRGVSGLGANMIADWADPQRNFEIDWKSVMGKPVNTSTLPVLPATNNLGMATDFASMLGDHPTNAVLKLNRKKSIRAFPLMQSGQDEWLLTRPDSTVVKGVKKPTNTAHDLWDVDVDYTQFAGGGPVQHFAKGGSKAGKLLSNWASSHLTIGDAGKYRLAQKVGFNPRMRPSEYDLLEYQADVGSPHLSQSEYDDWLDILLKHSVPVPESVAGDITTWRGVRLPKGATIDDYLKTTTGEHPAYTDLTEEGTHGYALHPAARHMTQAEYADIVETGHPNILQITPQAGVKIFPNVPGIANEVIYPPGHKMARVSEPWDKLIGDRFFGFNWGNPDVPAKAAQVFISKRRRPSRRTNMQEGGSVKDNCEGGMATISSMKRKYAGGGSTGGDPVQAITDALSHLDRGDQSAALQALQRSPQAMQDPGIQRAVQGFAKGGKVAAAASEQAYQMRRRKRVLDAVTGSQKRGPGPHKWNVYDDTKGTVDEISDVPGSSASDIMKGVEKKLGPFARMSSHWGDVGSVRSPKGFVGVGLDKDKTIAETKRVAAKEKEAGMGLYARPFRLVNSANGKEYGGRYVTRKEAEAEIKEYARDGDKNAPHLRVRMMDLPTAQRKNDYAKGGITKVLKKAGKPRVSQTLQGKPFDQATQYLTAVYPRWDGVGVKDHKGLLEIAADADDMLGGTRATTRVKKILGLAKGGSIGKQAKKGMDLVLKASESRTKGRILPEMEKEGADLFNSANASRPSNALYDEVDRLEMQLLTGRVDRNSPEGKALRAQAQKIRDKANRLRRKE